MTGHSLKPSGGRLGLKQPYELYLARRLPTKVTEGQLNWTSNFTYRASNPFKLVMWKHLWETATQDPHFHSQGDRKRKMSGIHGAQSVLFPTWASAKGAGRMELGAGLNAGAQFGCAACLSPDGRTALEVHLESKPSHFISATSSTYRIQTITLHLCHKKYI